MYFLVKSSSQDVFRTIGEVELSMTQLKLLHHVADEQEVALGELGKLVNLSLPAVSRAVEGLHNRKLVARREDSADRRMKRVTITAKGRDVVRRTTEARLAFVERVVAELSETERKRLTEALRPLLERGEIGSHRPGDGRA